MLISKVLSSSSKSSYLIIFLLFLLQFVYFPFGVSYFEVPKVYIAEIVIVLLFLGQLLENNVQIKPTSIFFLSTLVLIFLISIYHLLFNSTAYTFWGNPFRMQGSGLLWFLLLFSYLSSLNSLQKLSSVFLLVVLLVQAFLSVWIDSGILARAVGSLGEPNSLAGEMVFLWPFIYVTVAGKKFRWLWVIVVLLVTVLVIAFSSSRSGMIALAIQLMFLIGTQVFRWGFGKMILLTLLLLIVSLIIPFFNTDIVYENRAEVWQSAFTAGISRPMLGYGFGNIEFALHKTDLQLHNHLQGYYVDSSHNIFLDWFVSGGVVGLGALLWLVGNAIMHFVKRKSLLCLLLLLGLLGVLSFNPVSVVLLVAFWWVIGQGWNQLASRSQ
jgi:O-antigen ligase